MDNNLKKELLAEAVRIGDDLLDRAEIDEHGYSWKTMGMGENQSVVWNKSEGIYSGASGIILFFIELYKQTSDGKYLEAIKEGSRWIEHFCQQNPTGYYAFFTGRMGASYTMLQVGELLNDSSYKQKALVIAKDCEQFLEMPNGIDDLINGTSGTLLGLLHLHAHTQEHYLLSTIKKFTEHLIESAHLGSEGLYWDRSSKNIRGLCGFSHGASGIGYVFLELGKYFGNKDFYWLAEQAFTYENHYYNKEMENWPDFRKGYFDDKTLKEHKEEYSKGNKSFFTSPGNMSAWCHGAPGIGLSRLTAYELLNDQKYKKDVERAIAQTHKVTVAPENINTSYAVCHGGGGNAMLFLEAYRQSGEDKYLEYTEKVGVNGLEFIKEQGKYISGYAKADIEDYSLFMGNAGVGYFYLQLCEPLKTPSILKPDVTNTTLKVSFDLPINTIKTKIASSYFSKTMSLCSALELEEKENILQGIVDGISKAVEVANDERTTTIFNYEKEALALQSTIESDSYLQISNIVEVERNVILMEKSDNHLLLSTPLQINKYAKLLNTEWDCINIENKEKEDYYSLSIAGFDKVKEHELSQFSYLVLSGFETPKKGYYVLGEIITMYEATSEEDKKKIEDSVVNQIEEALRSGILVNA